ncbi:MAG: hypothetical protein HC819_22550 [Cyclobacteriaceae bacterium]|nr:hypothetical protein [Cyclobacteriaceae bacterium]
MGSLGAFLLMGISNCDIVEENNLASQNCTTGCNIIQGRLTTNNGNSGIGNVKLLLKWINYTSIFSVVIRSKAITRTQNDGTFMFEFRLNDDELYAGYFEIEYFVDESKFLILHKRTITLSSLTRDTIVDMEYLVPLKAYIQWEVKNNQKIVDDDYFHTTFRSPIGFAGEENGHAVDWRVPPSEALIEVAGNQKIYVMNSIKKNGIIYEKTDTLFIAAGETLPYTFDYLQ